MLRTPKILIQQSNPLTPPNIILSPPTYPAISRTSMLSSANNRYLPNTPSLLQCLPPSYHHQPIYGQFHLHLSPLIISSQTTSLSKQKYFGYRIRILGYQKNQCQIFRKQKQFTVHTSSKLFKQYLKDMRIILIQVLDQRNQEPIGHAYLNLINYMRAQDDNAPYQQKTSDKFQQPNFINYYLPFLDQQCEVTLPVFDFRVAKTISKKKDSGQKNLINPLMNTKDRIIGQISIKFMCRIYEFPIMKGYPVVQQVINEQSQLQVKETSRKSAIKNGRISISPSLSPSNNLISYPIIEQSPQNQVQYSLLEQKINSNKRSSLMKKGSNLEINGIQNVRNRSSIYAKGEQQEKQSQSNIYGVGDKRNYTDNQLELLQLKLDAHQFFHQHNQSTNDIPISMSHKVVIEILKLKSKLPNIAHLDIFLSDQTQAKDEFKSHVKIYRINQDKTKGQDFFNSLIIVERANNRVIQIQLPNNLGKCQFRCKDITGAKADISFYNKGLIIGTLSIRKQVQLSQNSGIKNPLSKQIANPKQSKLLSCLTPQICLITVQNLNQSYPKIHQPTTYDSYSIFLKTLQFTQYSLQNSRGQYGILQEEQMPRVFAIQIRNSQGQFVGKSQNINYQNGLNNIERNIMPTLIYQNNLKIQIKAMPTYKRLPATITFRLSIYIANATQLNYFINKWKQQNILAEIQKQRVMSSPKRNLLKKQKHDDRQKTVTVQSQQYKQSDRQQIQNRIKTQSIQSKYHKQKGYKNNKQDIISPSQASVPIKTQQKQSQLSHKPFKTLGNQTQQLKQDYQQHNQSQENIYLVEFFCKSLHFLLANLKSKQVIERKIYQLNNYPYSNQEKIVSKEQFQRVIKLINIQKQQMDFQVNQVLEALFVSHDDQQKIKLGQLVNSLTSYFNFLLLLVKQKQSLLKQLILCQPEADLKLGKVYQMMSNISESFLWQDILPNVIQKTKVRINKKYRINVNSPFLIQFLLSDIKQVKQSLVQSQSSLLSFYLSLRISSNQQLFMRLTGDMGNLVRQTIQQILLSNENSLWFVQLDTNLQMFVQREKQAASIMDQAFQFNLTQFQMFFQEISIQVSVWETLMIIEEIKVWYQTQANREQQLGEGIISLKLLKAWFNALNMKMNVKRNKIFKKNQSNLNQSKLSVKNSRLNSLKSISSDQQDLIQQINKKMQSKAQIPMNPSIIQVHQKPSLQPSLKSSQQFNNQSDVANIANLLRQNENNFFMPSMSNPKSIQHINHNDLTRNDKILKGLQQSNIRKLTQEDQLIKQKQKQVNSNQSQHSQSQSNYQEPKPSNYHYMKIVIKTIKLKKPQLLTRNSGLKKLQIYLKQQQQDLTIIPQQQNLQNKCHFFLTKQNVQKIINQSQQDQSSYQNYSLSNVLIDINNLYTKFQSRYRNGLIIQFINVNNPQKTQNKLTQNKHINQDRLLAGVLPIQDIINVIQQYRKQLEQKLIQQQQSSPFKQNQSSPFNQTIQPYFTYQKKKTIVLYSGRQICGKVVIGLQLSSQKQKQSVNVGYLKGTNLTTINISIKKRQLFNKKYASPAFNPLRTIMQLCYIRSSEFFHQPILLLPLINQNQSYQINLPQPIIQYQLILKTLSNDRIGSSIGQIGDNFSRFTNKTRGQVNQEEGEECVVPLETLYFKKYICDQYPLINKHTGKFIAKIQLKLQILDSLSQTNQINQINQTNHINHINQINQNNHNNSEQQIVNQSYYE